MSIEAISAVLHHSKSTGTARAVLTAIAWHIGQDPEDGCYPSQRTLGYMAGVSTRQVQRALTKLEELQEIEIAVHNGEGFRTDRITNRYWVMLDCPDTCDNSLNHRERGDRKGRTGRRLRRNGATYKTQRDGVDVVLKVI
jgi:hypothetical protein